MQNIPQTFSGAMPLATISTENALSPLSATSPARIHDSSLDKAIASALLHSNAQIAEEREEDKTQLNTLYALASSNFMKNNLGFTSFGKLSETLLITDLERANIVSVIEKVTIFILV
ncbi:hypothetical protein Ciccas_009523 [Cichlidogyrus casuarinus]|uniref:Uncharacterized protein n=1 Tax=Cichlidogyrus casuarinus TaxID=1844966 RepID=A0ABD2PZJ8_9PLAT